MAILLGVNFAGYRLVEGNMDEAQRQLARTLGAANLALATLPLLAAWLVHRIRGLRATMPWALGTIFVQTAYAWAAVAAMDDVIPRSIPSWIYPSDEYLYNQMTFALLPLFWGILRLAAVEPRRGFGRSFGLSLAAAVGAPIAIYLGGTTLAHLHFGSVHVVFIAAAVVLAGIVMFTGMARAMLLGLRKMGGDRPTGTRVAIFFFALVLPVCGLLLNRSIPFPTDFQAWEVYALTVANTIVLAIASFTRFTRPRLTAALLCLTLPFSLYFFLVFLPFTPLSLPAVLACGAGFLVLAPVILFILHLHLLNQARQAVRLGAAGLALCLGAFAVLPGCFLARCVADRAALHGALDYAFAPAIESRAESYDGSLTNLRRALASHRAYKNGIFMPLLSPFYSWLVFDNLVLPDAKLDRLDKMFLGSAGSRANRDPARSGWNRSSVRESRRIRPAAPVARTAILQSLALKTAADGAGSSLVTFQLDLRNPGDAPSEYVSAVPLPAGVVVAGFRLEVDGRMTPGRITERKTALWVYEMIRDSERRDPGLLRYVSDQEVELRVFPVPAGKSAKVEFDLLLPVAPAQLPALNPDPDLGAAIRQLAAAIPSTLTHGAHRAVFVPGGASPELPAVAREQYLHLIVDRSEASGFKGSLGDLLPEIRREFPAVKRVRVSLANYEVSAGEPELVALDQLEQWDAAALAHALPLAGGLALDRALALAICAHRDRELDHPAPGSFVPPEPVFVVVTDNPQLEPGDLTRTSAWAKLLPELKVCRWAQGGFAWLAGTKATVETPLLRLNAAVRPFVGGRVHEFPEVAATGTVEYYDPASRTWRPLPHVTARTGADRWTRAVDLTRENERYDRSPGDFESGLPRLVARSREAGILIPSTSYIVVANEAQWRMLERSEGQKLGQNAALEFQETPAPPLLWLALGFGAYLWFQARRTKAAKCSCDAGPDGGLRVAAGSS